MKKALVILCMFLAAAVSASELAYHDGSPEWIFNGGVSRGTWFHVEDFLPGAQGFTIEWAEIWLYSFDSPVFAEIWNGGEEGPAELLAQQEITGSPVWFGEPVETGADFWCLVSSEGPVDIITDGNSDGHSLYSDDFLVWEPFDLGEFFISVGNETESLSGATWAMIKRTF